MQLGLMIHEMTHSGFMRSRGEGLQNRQYMSQAGAVSGTGHAIPGSASTDFDSLSALPDPAVEMGSICIRPISALVRYAVRLKSKQ